MELKTFKVPVIKLLHTYAYIKCKDKETARAMIQGKTDVIAIDGEIEAVEPFTLGGIGDDRAT